MSIVGIILIVVVVVAVLAYFFFPAKHGPMNSVERSADQHNTVSGLGKTLKFQGDLERPRDEGGRPRGV